MSLRLRRIVGIVVVLFAAYLCAITIASPFFAHDKGTGSRWHDHPGPLKQITLGAPAPLRPRSGTSSRG